VHRCSRLIHLLGLTALFASSLASPIAAQDPGTGTVIVTVSESMGPVAGALIRLLPLRDSGISATTDARGRARLVLPAGRQSLLIARIGYDPHRVSVTVIADREIELPVTVEMEMAHAEMEDVVVSAARTERLSGETSIRVEVVDEMEVDEKTQMAPGGITMLLNETPGVRVQAASPSLGTGSVRILGLPGQYTAMLADGLPLYGGASSALGPLDISPVDLQRVELIKGAASALYGGQALGGVINLVSKPPTGRNEILLNKRTLGVTDGAAWLSRKFSDQAGASLLVSGSIQDAHDLDDDGWGDQPRARRWGVRPRFTLNDASGRSLFVTAGYGFDRRDGGTLAGAVAPDGQPFAEGLRGQRFDLGVAARLPTSESNNVALRFAVSTNGRERRFGPGPIEEDRISTGFVEVTRSINAEHAATVVGAVVQVDAYHNRLNDVFDHDWVIPGLFATGERDIGAITVSASLRADFHPDAGTQVTERVAALLRPADEWSVRLSAGTGFATPNGLTEETEAIGLRAVRAPASLDPERSLGVAMDIGGKVAGFEFLLTGYGSFIRDAVQLADAGINNDGVLRNAAGQTRVGGAELAAIRRFDGGKFLLTYGYALGSRTDADTDLRESVPLLPRHRIGADLMLERPGVYRIGIEGIWYGEQPLDDDPYRARSKPYFYTMFLAMRQFGALEVVANFENLLDIRQTDHDPLIRPTPMVGGRWTTEVWAPLEGFMANVAVRYRW
jgi:outer membrane receptor for ferrienterochelin and colicins